MAAKKQTSVKNSRKPDTRKRTQVKAEPAKKKNNNTLFIIAAVAIIIIGGAWLIMGGEDKENYDELNLPSYAYNNALTLQAYGYTIKNPEVIEKIPCYCGCEGIGHRSLKNCFISDDGVYSSHGSNCDICVGEVIQIKKLYESGMYISEIKEIIHKEYSRYGPGNGGVPITQDFNINLKEIAAQPTVTPIQPVDYSTLDLTPDFDSLADGLNLTPQGVIWAQFVNMKLASRTPLEQYASDRVQPVGFYGVPLAGMYSADYSSTSWIELHDIGYTSLGIQPVSSNGMSNVVVTRPFIYGHTNNVQQVRQLMESPSGMQNAYSHYQTVLEHGAGEDTVIAMVSTAPNQYADLFYSGMKDAGNGLVERVMVYHLVLGGEALTSQYESKAADSLANGFTRYDVTQDKDLLKVTIIGTLEKVLNEAL